MNYEINDRVIVENWDGKRRRGKVATITSIPDRKGGIIYEYGILIDDVPGLEHHTQATISLDNMSECDCGAVAAHFPRKPPGHAPYCTYEKHKDFIGGPYSWEGI